LLDNKNIFSPKY